MSSQHLEEADALADRICIMTHGQLLALDKPENIKKQFGVGYKLLIEPNYEHFSVESFSQFQKSSLNPIILKKDLTRVGVKESNDSTPKKLIYQIPFTEVQNLGPLLNELEMATNGQVYIDIELNTLEDAYINIAREEEKLLQNLKEHGMQRYTMSNKKRDSTINSNQDEGDDQTKEKLDAAIIAEQNRD